MRPLGQRTVLFHSFFALSSGSLFGAGFYEYLWLLKKIPMPRSAVAPNRPLRTG